MLKDLLVNIADVVTHEYYYCSFCTGAALLDYMIMKSTMAHCTHGVSSIQKLLEYKASKV